MSEPLRTAYRLGLVTAAIRSIGEPGFGVEDHRKKSKDEIQGSFALLRMTTGRADGRCVEGYGAERYGRYWLVEFFGVFPIRLR